MRVRPVSVEGLVDELADELISRKPDNFLRVGVDGAAAAEPGRLADALVDPLRLRGRDAVRVSTGDFLRPASLRLEFGRENPDSFYAGWFDEAGLAREVLDQAGPGGDGRILTRLRNPETDRAARDPYHPLPPGAVVLVSGPLLLGGGLGFDFVVHLELSPAALRRRTPADQQWTLPAFERYAGEVGPAGFADVVLRVDDPKRPAMVEQRW
ncbi:uridine kinase [Actinoplanes sp. NPDC051513]|uniref:uridine kinase n=1 Tax=Actinoplanes sp. NPDC051513 TaxID=3363908 RepID=UPI0037B076D9